MRIGVNVRFLLKNRLEGIGVYTHELTSRLVKLFPEHEFYFFFDRKWDESFIYDKNVHPVEVFPPARHPFLWYWWFEYSLPKAIKKNKIDLLFSPDGYASLSTDVPQLLTIHDLAFEHYPQQVSWLVSQYYRFYIPKFCKSAQKIIAVSDNTNDDIVSMYDIPKEKVEVISNGFSSEFKPLDVAEKQEVRLSLTEGAPYFIYVGAIHPRKNVSAILKAFETFKKATGLPHVLVLVGRRAWDIDEVDQILKEMQYKTSVIWREHAERVQIANWLAAAEALIYPSFLEGFGLPVLEAMACGIPSITTAESPMHGFAKDSCIPIQPDDIEGISNAMKEIVQNSQNSELLSERCLQYSKELTWDKAAEKLADILRGMVAEIKKNT